MANTIAQARGDTTLQNASAFTLAFSSPVTAGNLLTVAWRRVQSPVVSNVTDNLGNSWTVVYDANDTSVRAGGWAYTFTLTGGACTVSVNFASANTEGTLVISEYSGPNTVRAVAAVKNASTSSPVSNAITVQNGDLALGINENVSGSATTAAGAGFTMAATGTNAGNALVAVEYNLSVGAGSLTAGFTGTSANASTTGAGAFFFSPVSITGNARVVGVTITWSGTASGSTSTDGSGNYTIPNLQDGSYTITPSKTGTTFVPASSSITIVGFNKTGVNFSTSSTGTQNDMLNITRWCSRMWP